MFDSLLFMGATNFCLLISSAPSFNQSRCLILLVAEVFVFLAQGAFSLIGSSWNKLWMFQINSINSDLLFKLFLNCILLDVVSKTTRIITVSNFRESFMFNSVNFSFFFPIRSYNFINSKCIFHFTYQTICKFSQVFFIQIFLLDIKEVMFSFSNSIGRTIKMIYMLKYV